MLIAAGLAAAMLAIGVRWGLRHQHPGEARVWWTWTERSSWIAAILATISGIIGQVMPSKQRTSDIRVLATAGSPQGAPGLWSVALPDRDELVRGRDEVVRELTRTLSRRGRRRSRVQVLHGLGGCGKTTIAAVAAQRAIQRGYQVWWVTAAIESHVHAQLRQVASAAGASDAALEAAWSGRTSAPDLLWHVLEELPRRWLLVIDNADDPSILALPENRVAAGNGWIRPVQSRRGALIVTSRDGDAQTWGPWCRCHPIGMLAPADGAQVLLDRAGARAGTRDDAERLAERLGGLPLALRLAGTYLADTSRMPLPGSLSTFVDYQAALEGGRIDELFPGFDDASINSDAARNLVGRTWDLSLELLARRGLSKARGLLRLLAVFADALIPYQVILDPTILTNSVLFADTDAATLRQLLHGLASLNLIDLTRGSSDGNNKTLITTLARLHPLVRQTNQYNLQVSSETNDYLELSSHLVFAAAAYNPNLCVPENPVQWPLWSLLAPHVSYIFEQVANNNTVAQAARECVTSAAELCARYLAASGLFAQAEAEFRAIHDVWASIPGKECQALNSRFEIARALRLEGRYALAEEEFRAVQDGWLHLRGKDHPEAFKTRHELARVLRARGKYFESQKEFLALYAACRRTLGDEHTQTLSTRHELARVVRTLGHYEGAEIEFRAVHDIRKRSQGGDDPEVLTSRHELAQVLRLLGRWPEAEVEIRAVVEARSRILGGQHVRTLASRHELGTLLRHQARFAEAEALLSSVYSTRQRLLGEEHPDTLATRHEIGAMQRGRGYYLSAETELAAVYRAWQNVLGPDHPHTITTLFEIAALQAQRGDRKAAEASLIKVLDVRKRVLGEDHPETLNAAQVLLNISKLNNVEH